ncbi:hypothetical protein BFP72_14790 [Reichenbachiella sp. 5M10]|uniref:hypothetical protein n=1 Tax=Reichenbachiella sp. 5M10 TaxID=1889772 RepID=UPI000C155DC9|nr:hypothetical protein [Reichenbachiella sp. 5M10]PIB36577.1 hypothetical protein BFP72_14790 [Reichenbachiella sp. 5M10]
MTIQYAIKNTLNQMSLLIAALSDEEYSQVSVSLNHSTIGQHVRHTLEFFTCLLEQYPQGVINYDRRSRDPEIETMARRALDLIEEIGVGLDRLVGGEEMVLEQSVGESEECIIVPTNLDRELIYNLEHVVHHMALIRVGLREVKPMLHLDESFGVASSTLKFREAQAKA